MKLGDILHFDPNILTDGNDDSDLNTAIDAVLPLLRGKSIALDVEKECLEVVVLQELISNFFKNIASSIILERNYSEWVSEECSDGDGITSDHLGLGCNLTTWYGSPDVRLRGLSTDCDVVFSGYDNGDESDGGSTILEVKRKSSSQAIGTAVISSFTEHSLHTSLNSLVPTILINCYTAEVYLYDCVSDVLLITERVDFRKELHVTKSGILFLWLFINHRHVVANPPTIQGAWSNLKNMLDASKLTTLYWTH